MTTERLLCNILEVDLRAEENNVKHHTDELSTVDLIVRRGQGFRIRLKFKGAFKPDVHQLKFTAFTGYHEDEKRGTKSVFGIPDVERSAEAKAVWRAEISKKKSTDPEKEESDPEDPVDPEDPEDPESDPEDPESDPEKKKRKRKESDAKKKNRKSKESDAEKKKRRREECSEFITITPPADAPVGRYSLSVSCSGEDTELEPVSPRLLVLLFNPWCPEDSVYMAKKRARQEYVMNENGIIFRGSGTCIFPSPWDYGQFEENMPDIVMNLLYLNQNHLDDPGKDEASWCDPIYVGRVLSAMINCQDDPGVLQGRWDGDYEDGIAPTHWNGSYAILTQWFYSGFHPVKYGQCWVFAAVMCSVMRTLGIPCRVVTNFESAHDTDMNLTIDVYHAGKGAEEKESGDSVWNFHVWVEGWMKRPDLSEDGTYDGWQVLDPTPQELSGGIFQCGPASVKAIHEGKTDLKYDVPFVFAEVNADCVDWLVKADGTLKKLWSDSTRVGQNISTKCIGSDMRKNITRTYKPKEGSEKERAAFKYACARDHSNKDGEMDSEESEIEDGEACDEHDEPGPDLPKVSMKFEESVLENGKDVKLNLVLHSEAIERRTLSIDISVRAKGYTGSAHVVIQHEVKEETLHPFTDLRIPVEVPFSKYWQPMLNNDVMNVSAIVSDAHDDSEVYLAEDDLVLEDPPIEVKVLGEALVSQELSVEIVFVNPVTETLKNCTFTLSGSGLCSDEKDKRVEDIGPKKSIQLKESFVPYKCGKKTLTVDFNCSVFRDIKKSITVDVKRNN